MRNQMKAGIFWLWKKNGGEIKEPLGFPSAALVAQWSHMGEIIKVICNCESPSTPHFNIGGKATAGEQKKFPQKRSSNIK